jgi:hypothetical protein
MFDDVVEIILPDGGGEVAGTRYVSFAFMLMTSILTQYI